jgi:uncharacterized membrane protein YhhN
MTSSSWLFLALFGIAAATDWWAVATSNRKVEYIAKPVTLVALILVAVTLDPDVDAMRTWFVVALICSLVGDVFLMLPRDLFLQGLGSFLLGHVAYVVGFLTADIGGGTLLLVGSIVAIAVFLYAGFLIGRMSGTKRAMRIPVALYALAIGTMLTCALALRSPWAAAGALLFVSSDGLIGYSRFVKMPEWAPVAIIVTYHLGQAGLVLSLVYD